MKKVFIASAALFAVTLLFLGVYTVAFRKGTSDPTASEDRKRTAQEEADERFESGLQDGEAVIEAVSDGPVYGAAAVGTNDVAFFRDGTLWQFTLGGGGERAIVSDVSGKVLEVGWAPDRHAVLALIENGSERRWHLVDLANRSVKALKDGIAAPAWSNLSERIFYLYRDVDGKVSVNTSKPDGSDWEELAGAPALREPVGRMIPGSASFSFFSRPSAYEETVLYSVPIAGGDVRRIFGGKYGADFSWSPDGEKLLISNTVARGGADVRLGIANQGGGEFHTLQVPTFVSKTAWSKDGQTVYYALPLSLPKSVALPDDYMSRAIVTSDSFWKLDTETGKSERIVSPEDISGDFDSADLFLDEAEDFLFFVNRRDNRLYRIGLR